jgi:hypothetical protein
MLQLSNYYLKISVQEGNHHFKVKCMEELGFDIWVVG